MRNALGALAAVVLIGVAACGSNPTDSYKKTDPATIAADALTALKATTGIHLAGTVQLGSETMTVDLTSDLSGGVTGTVVLAGSTLQILGTGGPRRTVYIKAGTDFWGKIAPASSAQLAGKWVQNVTLLPDVIKQLTLPNLMANEAKYPWESAKPQLLGIGNVNGTASVQITVTDRASTNGAQETLDVSASVPHRVLRESEGTAFSLTFDRFDATVSAPAPAAADVVDLVKVLAKK
ncbi:hypothetical protein Back2_18740 [Nocardioides baekrokdamisoli]|uniref:Lipoprotein n=1 Tax=Nocardioides baekrokdamisoli TaxID=1804624 RepID=A0A3G9IF55_9ACTN|nr:hypothetical protein [Nocardioides baekrokdamisoli]BBH17587.1 hypothetical protein Back2_18740 [Nocardioides baekrokdamisoli]